MTVNRRNFLAGSLVAAGGGLLASKLTASEAKSQPKRSLRFAHFGDTHVGGGATMPFCVSEAGYPKALKLVHELAGDEAPEFILHTGDIITDAFWATQESARQQWEAYRKVMKEHCTLPVRYTLGNHDVNFGWGLGDDNTPYPGKSLALEQTGLKSPYYNFDHGGWHFVVLDNTQRGGWNGFQILLDDRQFEWFAKTWKRPIPTRRL